MKRFTAVSGCALVLTVGLLGCDGDDDAPPQAATPAPQRTIEPPSAPGGAAGPARTPQPAAPTNTPGVATSNQPSSPPAQPAATNTPDPRPTGTPQQSASPPAAKSTPPPRPSAQRPAQRPTVKQTPPEQARALMDQLLAQQNNSQWAEGEKTIQELEKLKGRVPPEMRDEIDNARASFRVAKQIFNQDR